MRARVKRYLTSAPSDIMANRQVDARETAWVWAYPVETVQQTTPLETALIRDFHRKSAVTNGKVPPAPAGVVQEIPNPFQIVQVVTDGETLENADPSLPPSKPNTTAGSSATSWR